MNKILTALILSALMLTAASAQELRGIWLDANSIPKTESEITALVDKYADAGINVIFPETVAGRDGMIFTLRYPKEKEPAETEIRLKEDWQRS